jgi:hypothetical protein
MPLDRLPSTGAPHPGMDGQSSAASAGQVEPRENTV